MKSDTLRQLITTEFFRTILIPFAVIELMLLVVYFGINSYVSYENKIRLTNKVRHNMQDFSSQFAQSIDARLLNIESLIDLYRKENERLFRAPEQFALPYEPHFAKAANGVYYQTNNNGSSLYYSAATTIGASERAKARLSAALDPLYRHIKEADPMITAVYLNTHDSMSRYYPYIDKVYTQFEPVIDIPKFNFYYEADSTHNPDKKVVWTDVYLDPAGQGWMASCIAPVYRADFLEGVVGLDITVNTFVDQIHKLKLPWGAGAFLVDRSGTILAMQSNAEHILGLKELKKHTYDTTIKDNTAKPDEFNLAKTPNREVRTQMAPLFTGAQTFDVAIGTKHYLAFAHKISRTGWRFVMLIDTDILYQTINELALLTRMIGYGAIGFMLIFYVVFIVYIIRRSHQLSKRVAEPVERLEAATSAMVDELKTVAIEPVGIKEIDALIENFSSMSERLLGLYATMQDEIAHGVAELRKKDNQLIAQSRQAAMGEMIANIAHHWRQPINAVNLLVVDLKEAYEFGELTQELIDTQTAKINSIIQGMSKTIDDFRYFFVSEGRPELFVACDAVAKAVELNEPIVAAHHMTLVAERTGGFKVWGYMNEIIQVLTQLIKNSIDALMQHSTGEEGVITVRCYDRDNHAVIEVSDNGSGIDSSVAKRLFEPYVSTKGVAHGLGIGLYMAKTIVERSLGGSIDLTSTEHGVRVTITLPRADTVA